MTLAQAERIRGVRSEFLALWRNHIHIGASQIPTIRAELSAALKLRDPTPWMENADHVEYPETKDGTQHLVLAECNIPTSYLYLIQPELQGLLHEISDLRELITITRVQWQRFLLRASNEYRAVKHTLPANKQ